MNVRHLIALFCVACAPFVSAQVQLEKPTTPPASTETTPSASPSTAEPTAPAPAQTPAPAPVTLPPPPEPPRAANPIGLLILAIILSHVCLPVGVIIGIVLLLLVLKLFRGGITKVLLGVAATSGGAKAIRTALVVIGCFIVLPAGFMGLNWASKWMDYRVSGATWWIYGLVVSVLTGLVFFSIVKAIARALKKKFMGNMGGMAGLAGMGGMGGFVGMPGMNGGRDLPGRNRGKKRR